MNRLVTVAFDPSLGELGQSGGRVRAPLSRSRQCWHCPVIKQDNRAEEIGMPGVPPDRRFFIPLDVDAIELARTLCDEDCSPPRGWWSIRSQAAVARPQIAKDEPTKFCALPASILAMVAALGVNRVYSAPVKLQRRRQPRASSGQNLTLGTRQLRLESD